jgi:hypothetical protein
MTKLYLKEASKSRSNGWLEVSGLSKAYVARIVPKVICKELEARKGV